MEILFGLLGRALAVGSVVLLAIVGQAVLRRRVDRHRTEALAFLAIALVTLVAGIWMIWVADRSRTVPGGF